MSTKDALYNGLVFDGAMGTMLIEEGLKAEDCPEKLNIEKPEIIKDIHRLYIEAGADVITTNTFGGNRIKLAEYGLEKVLKEINKNAVKIAKEAAKEKNCLIAASIGPTGKFVEPMGELSFDHAYEIFKEQIKVLAKEGPDFIIFETFSDLGELRAGVIAAKDVCDIPIICSLTFEGERTLTGVTPASAAVVLESLGVEAIGANCSGGPKELFPAVKELAKTTELPIIFQPNAGLPSLKNKKVIYSLNSDEFITYIEPYLNLGVNVFGACCGSTPDFIKKLKDRLKDYSPKKRVVKEEGLLSSRGKVVRIKKDLPPKIIGERINPSGKKKLAESLKTGNYGIIQREAELQIKSGAHLLDVNVGIHSIDESSAMVNVINLLQKNFDIPLVIDSINPEVIEKALKTYHGKALVNSVNGEEKSIKRILPLVKRYGAGVIGLTLDENGIPKKAEERLLIAQKIVNKCLEYGISKDDIYIDCLVLTVGTDNTSPMETLKALRMIKEKLEVKTILGISNVSHGMPKRYKLNSAFLAMAISNGLDLAFINPLEKNIIDTFKAASLLSGRDNNYKYLKLNNKENEEYVEIERNFKPSFKSVKNLLIKGSYDAIEHAKTLLQEGTEPLSIINEGLIPGLNIVGDKFEKGEYYLPQLMLSSEIAQDIFNILEDELRKTKKQSKKGTIVLGTVKGDIHDIGKDMVGVILKTYGYKVVDLGKNILKEKFLEAAVNEKADFIGLSSLMTTTMMEIPKTIKYLKERLPKIKVIVGGAVVTEDFAKKSGADGYSQDALGVIRVLEKLK
ncbi:homocysteine S-methyltransferase family protein [Thermohalobacter berrensis]|uniref:Methionine synthase n=1 Tax=Thermohalobacter berrensis TaxID=99594 RepID=A0A419T9M5_9FIRM|nr:homocysteine S-methyltransferase family protein [Thermohalobacter berrensis]RKD34180.1 hypothetical protein BET03_07775 [Thermohalobacter berrensis]